MRDRLTYKAGNENNPCDPIGRTELSIEPDGPARLDHFQSRHRGQRAWRGRVDAAAVEGIWIALDRAGFPDVARHRLVAGATLRVLSAISAAGTMRTVRVEWSIARKLPGYDAAFALLDAIVRQLSEDSVHYPASSKPLVSDVQRA